MSNFARWEQEARQPLGPLQPDIPQPDPGSIPQQTVEVDMIELLAQEPETARPAPSTAEHEIAEIHALLAAEEEAAHDADDPAQDDAAAYDEDDPAAYDEDDVSEEASADRAVATRERLTEAGRSLAGTGRSFGRWVASLDRRPEFSLHHERDPLAQLGSGTPDAPADEPSGETPSFAVAPARLQPPGRRRAPSPGSRPSSASCGPCATAPRRRSRSPRRSSASARRPRRSSWWPMTGPTRPPAGPRSRPSAGSATPTPAPSGSSPTPSDGCASSTRRPTRSGVSASGCSRTCVSSAPRSPPWPTTPTSGSPPTRWRWPASGMPRRTPGRGGPERDGGVDHLASGAVLAALLFDFDGLLYDSETSAYEPGVSTTPSSVRPSRGSCGAPR